MNKVIRLSQKYLFVVVVFFPSFFSFHFTSLHFISSNGNCRFMTHPCHSHRKGLSRIRSLCIYRTRTCSYCRYHPYGYLSTFSHFHQPTSSTHFIISPLSLFSLVSSNNQRLSVHLFISICVTALASVVTSVVKAVRSKTVCSTTMK